MPEDELLKQLADRKSTFVYLRHKMDASVGHKIDQLIEGIDTVIEPKRSYPQGYLASQVLGMVGSENTGLAGSSTRRRTRSARTAAGAWSRTRSGSRSR